MTNLNEITDLIEVHKIKFFGDPSLIFIPKKAETAVKKYISAKLKKQICKDKKIAEDIILLILSQLSYTLYDDRDHSKALSSTLLHNLTKLPNNNTFVYKKALNALMVGTKEKGPIIKVLTNSNGVASYQVGKSSKKYIITHTYSDCKLITYKLRTNYLINRIRQEKYKLLIKVMDNQIGKNLINMYSKIELPSIEDILKKGKELSKKGFKNKKGKLLTFKGKKSKDYWKNPDKRVFVEDHINIFKRLTENGYMIPVITGNKAGGRIVDSFNLMPSWIREMITVDGKQLTELDFTSLHPNIANKIYKGSGAHISHSEVAEYLSIDKKEAKLEHLSFFNKRIVDMKKSPLYKYYSDKEKEMLFNLIKDKTNNGYKKTSERLFNIEVSIMSDIIKELNSIDIYALYIYDALIVEDKYKNVVKSIMNKVILRYKINTFVK